MIAGILQIVPLIGPSLLITALVPAEALAGEFASVIIVLRVGGVVVVGAPDLVVPPRLARWTANLSNALYFVGIVSALRSLGTLGIMVGPLLVALLVEADKLLSSSFAGESVPETTRPVRDNRTRIRTVFSRDAPLAPWPTGGSTRGPWDRCPSAAPR